MSSSPPAPGKSPLEAAQKIVDELRGIAPEQQMLAIKFACETLGLNAPTAIAPPAQPTPPAHQHTHPNSPSAAGHSSDIRTFTTLKSPKSDQQFAAVVAYFYQFEAKAESKKESIDSETMKEAARLAGRPQVERWNMTLTNAKNAGYLDAAGPGKFKLSSVGENLVAITLPGNTASGPPKSQTKASRYKKRAVKKKKK